MVLDPQTLAQQVASRLSNINARIFGVPTLKVWTQGEYVDWEKDDCIIRCQLNNHIKGSFTVPQTAVAQLSREEIFEQYAIPALKPFKRQFDAEAKRVMISAPLIEVAKEGLEHARAQSKGLHVSVTLEFSEVTREYKYTLETLFGAFDV